MTVLKMLPYLARINAAVNPCTNHVTGDMVAIHFWLLAVIVRSQSYSSLLQSGVSHSLCQIKHK